MVIKVAKYSARYATDSGQVCHATFTVYVEGLDAVASVAEDWAKIEGLQGEVTASIYREVETRSRKVQVEYPVLIHRFVI